MAEDVTVGQIIEFVNKQSREQIRLLEQITKGEIARHALQQMITPSKRSPQERLARSLLRKAQSPRLALLRCGNPSSPAEIAAVYELLGESEVADKITYQSGNESTVYSRRIEALCEKNNLERARKLTYTLYEDSRSLAWATIAGKSQQQSDYDQVKSPSFTVKLAVAVSRAKVGQEQTLIEMRVQKEKTDYLHAINNHEYLSLLLATAKDCTYKKNFQTSRGVIHKLADSGSKNFQLEAALMLAQTSKDPKDIALYREIAGRVFTHGELRHAVHLAHIAAITGDEKDFAACQEMIDRHETTYLPDKGLAYSALALAYAECGDISTARDIVNKKIVVPDVEATTLARMARIVLSQDLQ